VPTDSQHRKKAEVNRAFLATIARDDYPEWAVVAAFYTAVHLVERLRARDGGHSEDHRDRLDYVQRNHDGIHTAYQQLLRASMLARYDSRGDFFDKFQPEDVADVIVGRYLAAVEAYVAARLDA